MMGMNMGDADATPAYDVVNAELKTGDFQMLETRPAAYEVVSGSAWIARHSEGTTITLDLEGLVPDRRYISHVHVGSCSELGGPHYQFDVGGSTMPPNEIHLAFTATSAGTGFITAENSRRANGTAQSVVVHEVDALDDKIACAEFGG